VDPGLAGREAEVAEIFSFLSAGVGAPSALVIAGDTGIGKTVLWKQVTHAAPAAYRVLSCRPAPAEAPLAFAALDDLFGEVIDEVLPELPQARRSALEIALRGSVPGPAADGPGDAARPEPELRLLARAVLDAVRILSGDKPVLIAIDDAQWLDRPSAAVLEFCIRRLDHAAVSILLTLQGEDPACPLGLDQALPPGRLVRVQLGGLSQAAIGRILCSRLGVTFPGYVLTRLHEACGGNPLYSLESARALLERGRPYSVSEPIPIPEGISELVRPRLRTLAPDALRVGRLIAAATDPREHVIWAASGGQESWVAMDQVIDNGLVERDSDALRFTHPLLGPVLYAEMTMSERRDVHRRLAAGAGDIEEQAWHRALGAEGPCDEIASLLDEAMRHAAARGAPESAAALGEQAVRLTPMRLPGSRRTRILHAADHHFRAGEIGRSRELIESALTECGAGPGRASLLIRLASIHYHQSSWTLADKLFSQAAETAVAEPGARETGAAALALRSHAEAELSLTRLAAGDLPAASRWANASLRSAQRAGRPRLVAQASARLALSEFLQGGAVPAGLLSRAEVPGPRAGTEAAPAVAARAEDEPLERLALFGPSFVRGAILAWCDRLDEARHCFTGCYRRALAHGDKASLPFLLSHLSELEVWAGNWDAAADHALEGLAVASESHQQAMRPTALCALALVQAHQGRLDQARESATEALALCERSGNVFGTARVLSVLGFAALSRGDYETARTHLARLERGCAAAGLGEPGVLRSLPDQIDTLAALGEVSLAQSLTRRLHAHGRSRDRAWALATAARCRAHLAGMIGDHDGAQEACEAALSEHDRLAMPFDRGRTLLVKGITERRARRKSAASDSFAKALSVFERLGATLWAAKAREELSKVAPRPPANGLTETQHQVAALISRGQTNREIAAAMFVTVNTVQTHIRHIFQKLGVRSRTELAAMFLAASSGAEVGSRSLESPETG
jgi:DNA-binding CsgD family transcriptional regulator